MKARLYSKDGSKQRETVVSSPAPLTLQKVQEYWTAGDMDLAHSWGGRIHFKLSHVERQEIPAPSWRIYRPAPEVIETAIYEETTAEEIAVISRIAELAQSERDAAARATQAAQNAYEAQERAAREARRRQNDLANDLSVTRQQTIDIRTSAVPMNPAYHHELYYSSPGSSALGTYYSPVAVPSKPVEIAKEEPKPSVPEPVEPKRRLMKK